MRVTLLLFALWILLLLSTLTILLSHYQDAGVRTGGVLVVDNQRRGGDGVVFAKA